MRERKKRRERKREIWHVGLHGEQMPNSGKWTEITGDPRRKRRGDRRRRGVLEICSVLDGFFVACSFFLLPADQEFICTWIMYVHRPIYTYKRNHIYTHTNCIDKSLTFSIKYNTVCRICNAKYNIIQYTLQYNAKYNIIQYSMYNVVECCTMLRIRGSGSFWNAVLKKRH